jgi:spore maturation protein CgeB
MRVVLLRIFEILESSTNLSLPSNRTWFRNLYEPLVEMEHEVILFPAEEGRLAMLRKDKKLQAAFSQKLLDKFRKVHAKKPIDLFFAYLMDGMIDPKVIDEVHHYGVPTCNFSCNNIHQFYLVDELSTHFEYNLHAEREARDKFLAIGSNPIWWPMASNPRYFKPLNLPRTIAVSFVGANYALRSRYIANLLENQIDVHAYGPGWTDGLRSLLKRFYLAFKAFFAFSPQSRYRASSKLTDFDLRLYLRNFFPNNLHPPVSDDELIALYSKSQISLGFLEVYDQHDPSRIITQHLHLREFEAPMSGALYCTGFSDELAEMFEPDKEILVYRNQYELLDKVNYYLKHPERGEQIRQAGRARALRNHTYHLRFRSLFKFLGLE